MKSLIRLYGFVRPYRMKAIAALILLLGMVAADLLIPRLTQRIIDQGIFHRDLHIVWTTALIMLGVAILSALFAIINNSLSVQVGQSFAADLRSALIRKVQGFSFGNLDHLKTGQLIVRSTSDVNYTQMIVQMSLRILTRAPIWMIGAIVFLVLTSVKLGLVVLAFFPVIVLFVLLFAGPARKGFLGIQKRLDRLNTVLQENLAGVRVVKAFVREPHEIKRFGFANEELTGQSIRVFRLLALLLPLMTIILNAAVITALWFGGRMTMSGTMTVGEVVASVNYLSMALFPMIMLAAMVGPVSAADASASRILEVLDGEPDVRERPGAQTLASPEGRITFEDVCFSYTNDCDDPVLQGISFVAEPGETVAILGATGSGKSTLIHLIPRFYEVSSGRVTFDGIDIRDVALHSLRAQIGIALQEAVLFGGTIRENIRYGRPEASEAEILVAAEAAQAAEFIHTFPDGLDTVIGQRGVNLSGGQRQRLAIARALLVKPRVLILDDSTSAVDIETEVRLQDALDRLIESAAGKTTCFIVAQRISTVLLADRILVLDAGRIAASGTHQELMQSSSIYQDIYRSQLGEGAPTVGSSPTDASQQGAKEVGHV
ncbi:ABC transporter ATP-binding protein/permease [Candidatus Bipolaricaulota bacterium]|nr:ABC transporter ATP-binding protein/permease [Candidatus Bipolaricaulota bacterium]